MKLFVALLCLALGASAASVPARKKPMHLRAYFPHLRQGDDYSRIVGGEPAPEHEYPFMAAVSIELPDGTHFCGGTILSETRVMTAAHCAAGVSNVTIVAGTNHKDDPNESRQVVKSDVLMVHPEWSPLLIRNDIAIIHLDQQPLVFNENVTAVERASVAAAEGDLMTAVGWGKISDESDVTSPDLNYVSDLPVISDAEAADEYGDFPGWDDKFCTKTSDGSGVCNGDSGGPVLNAQGQQAGINSFVSNSGCEALNTAHCYTDVKYFEAWIDSHMP